MVLTANPLLIDNALWIAAFVLLVPTTIFAILGPAIVRRYVPLERLRSNNEVAGFKFATVGVIFAVLLAFAILVVWERFNQADSSLTRRYGGLGLGLAIARHLTELHGGHIEARSEGLGKGSTFIVTLPLLPLHPEPLREETLVRNALVLSASSTRPPSPPSSRRTRYPHRESWRAHAGACRASSAPEGSLRVC